MLKGIAAFVEEFLQAMQTQTGNVVDHLVQHRVIVEQHASALQNADARAAHQVTIVDIELV